MSTYNLSSNRLPDHLLGIILALQDVLGDKAYDFLLIGASARDLIMDGIYSLGVSRGTEDVDFALYVPEWDTYESTLKKLVTSGHFQTTRITHKLLFKDRYEVDIVPFGEIQNEEGFYTWPPEHIKAMNVSGFVEVYDGGVEVKTDQTAFRIASIPGICVMKLLAWRDRGYRDNRDGRDLGFILDNYIELKYEDLYELHEDLMEANDFDRVITTARIMGRDIVAILKSNAVALQQIKDILRKESEDEEYSRLAIAMKDGSTFQYLTSYKCLLAIIKGMEDKQ